MKKADIGLIGLAVMGENLVMNMESKGFTVAVYNRTTEKTDRFIAGRAAGKNIIGCHTLEEFVSQLERPRKVFMMVKAGQAVDDMIEQLLPLLDDYDILIDGGNSHFPDTIRRTAYVESKGKLYIGTGVSGGEEGALKGPSMMPGGSPVAWPYVKPIFQAICAKVEDGSPCCEWVGENGAGHFVKMVHNGIEYGDMQLICEAYQLMRDYLRMSDGEMHQAFAAWNDTELDSYLIEITRDIPAEHFRACILYMLKFLQKQSIFSAQFLQFLRQLCKSNSNSRLQMIRRKGSSFFSLISAVRSLAFSLICCTRLV